MHYYRYIVVALAGFATLNAGVMPTPGSENVTKLLNDSSVVLKGTVKKIEIRGEENGEFLGQLIPLKRARAVIEVDRVYKGNIKSHTTEISYSFPSDLRLCGVNPCTLFTPGEYRLFFLKEHGSELRLLNLFQSRYEVSEMNSPEAIINRSPGTLLQDDLVAGLSDKSRKKVVANIRLLSGLGDARVVPILKRKIHGASLEEQGWIYLGLLKLHDYSELKATGLFLEIQSSVPEIRFLHGLLAGPIESIRDPQAASDLRRMSSSRSDIARTAAIAALRRTADVKNVPIFVKALSDPIQRIRYNAVMGLCQTETGGKGCEADSNMFWHSEAEYIQSWKAWWENQGKQKYSAISH